jgi:hypothetical protein
MKKQSEFESVVARRLATHTSMLKGERGAFGSETRREFTVLSFVVVEDFTHGDGSGIGITDRCGKTKREKKEARTEIREQETEIAHKRMEIADNAPRSLAA